MWGNLTLRRPSIILPHVKLETGPGKTRAESLDGVVQSPPGVEDQYTLTFAGGRDGEKALRLSMCHVDSLCRGVSAGRDCNLEHLFCVENSASSRRGEHPTSSKAQIQCGYIITLIRIEPPT
jgi:hypothetical protein